MGSICGEELMHMKEMGSSEERIVVSVRLRPLNGKEIGRNDVIDWECIDDNTIIYRNNNATERTNYPNAYTFDRVFRCECPTKQVYDEAAKKVALSVVSGINASIFAYGQTSSGKTYTMSGITEFTVEDIYDYIQRHEEREFVLKFSAMEIYNESVRDLLSTDATPLRLLDDPERGTVVDRLTEETLRDLDHLKELLSVCEAQRQIGETSLNEASSRSHQILRLSIESSARAFLGKGHSSTLSASVSFVDLAGSERASQTLSAGTRLKEGCHINRSLLTLGTVIRKLSKGRNGHVPYRDSKLTRILHCSLGGNARTAIICTISPARSHVEQSRNTLSFASCAKEVSINAQVNVVMSDKALVKQLQRELARLEGELRSPGPTSATRESASLLREKDLKIEKLETEIKQLTQQLHLAQSRLEDLDDQASQWSEFSQPLRIRTRSIQDLIHLDRDDASQHWAEFNHRPRIRAPNTLSDDDLISESSGVADRHCLDIGFTRFNSSQYSNACSESNDDPDEPDLQLPEIPVDQFLCDGASPRFSSSNTKFVEADPEVIIQDGKVTQDNDENSEEICKEVQCIKVDESSANRKAESNTLSMGESEGMLPKTLTENGAPTDWAPSSSPQKEDDQLKKAQSTIDSLVHPLPNEPSAWSSEANLSSSKSSKLTRSRSCRAGLMAGSSPPWFQKADQNETTPPNGHEKDFPGRPKDFEIKLAALNYSPSRPWFSRECSFTSDQSASTDESKVYNMGNPSTEDATSIHTCDSGLKEMSKLHQEKQEMDTQLTVCCSDESKVQSSETQSEEDNASVYSCISIEKEMARLLYGKQATDDQVQETEQKTDGSENIVKDVEETEQKTDESEKTVKDVGLEQVQETEQKTNGSEKTVKDVSLHPVHDTVESLPKWQLDFERLQREIIELWDTCYVSLVHRTYFFLLFKGDPSDSIYMEVERRRLSFLRDRMSRGPKDKLILDGVPYLSPSSSMKALRREREMLSKQMLKRLSEKERLELYSKWGIGLSTKQRRLQLVRLLWTDTNDMNHITESANLVVRLVGHLEPGQALKEMFGLSLSFVPQQMGRRSFSWSKGMTTFL